VFVGLKTNESYKIKGLRGAKEEMRVGG
jgi:hypothetical protein